MAATLGLSGYTLEGNQIVWRYRGQTPSVASPYASRGVPLHPGYSLGYPASLPVPDLPADAPVEMVVRVEPGALVVDFVTLGEPFVLPARVAETDFADFPEGGFGLNIMREATDAVEHWHEMGVNTVRLKCLLPNLGV